MIREGIYEEIFNDYLQKELKSLDSDFFGIKKESIDVEEAKKLLSLYISNVTRKALKFVRDNESDEKDALLKQIQICNDIISLLSEKIDHEEFQGLNISEHGEILTAIYKRINTYKNKKSENVVRPITPISQSSLFTGSNLEPNMMSELKKEILSSDRIDMLVSFIKWSGLRCIIDELTSFTENGGKLRVITTSYMEATDYKAIVELSKLRNTKIRISYDIKSTRLHAKAYYFKRDSGFSTAYIGSSNLSNPALTSGLEWNIKVTEKDSFDVVKKFEATFESYWNDKEFYSFDGKSEKDKEKLNRALKKKNKEDENNIFFAFDIQPYNYQKEMLEKLRVEREVFGRHKNLLVAATGVGKTVISAFDYKRFKKNNGNKAKLLFVAHREEILKQSLDTFRAILKDFNFGDLLVGRSNPESLDYLFVSIQSFNSTKLYEHVSNDFYDFIIVDEFHHAAAASYQKLLSYFQPKILLGLTATPERMDNQDIFSYFDHSLAAEMRLTEAINRKLLSPFQYFCVSDSEDLSKLKWRKKGYDIRELEKVYTSSSVRSNLIVQSIYKYVTDINDVRGLGFCVSVEHAKYMADFFNYMNIPSVALHGNSDQKTRNNVQNQLVNGEIKFIFVVDLYNEGVDIPDINTVLFLRPTESLTVFLQQLGRGLRLSDGKECLTVLDFVGQAHKNYSFEEKFRALVGKKKHSIRHYVELGFFDMPKGCFIQLEKQAKEYILRNIKESANTKPHLIKKMNFFSKDTGLELTLKNFLEHHNLSLYEFYGKNGDRTFANLKAVAENRSDFSIPNESYIAKRLPNLFHFNSKKLLTFLISYIQNRRIENQEEQLMLNVFYYSFYKSIPEKEGLSTIENGVDKIISHPQIKNEILEILQFNFNHLDMIESEHDFDFVCPLGVHSSYSRAQVLAGLGDYNEMQSPEIREGVKHIRDKKLDIFFITLNKSEKDFSPSTLYEDYAINESLFHWQTQSGVSENTPTAQRYINHRKLDHQIALFVREYKKENGYTSPFTFLGTADYVSHSEDKPMSFVWKLKTELPPSFVPKARKNVI